MHKPAFLRSMGVLAVTILLSGCGNLLALLGDTSTPTTETEGSTTTRDLDSDFALIGGN